MLDLVSERRPLALIEGFGSGDIIAICLRLLGDKSALAQNWDVFLESLLLGENLDIVHQLIVRNSLEGILNPASRKS